MWKGELMEITYISHSGFLIEWESCYFLFDYYKGEIPSLDTHKKLFVFSSHSHHDHFNPVVFSLVEQHPNIEFVLSFDIAYTNKTESIIYVHHSQEYVLYDNQQEKIIVTTLQSTDAGVAFLIHYLDKTIYFAGDLNWWLWSGETQHYNDTMTTMFLKQMQLLQGIPIDIAFAPLDPRQEEHYYLGLEKLINTAQVKYVFPMHFWGQPSIIQQFKKERASYLNHAQIMEISQEGQQWSIDR